MNSSILLDSFFRPDRDTDFYSSFLLTSPRSQSFSPPDSGFASNDSNSHSPPSSLDIEQANGLLLPSKHLPHPSNNYPVLLPAQPGSYSSTSSQEPHYATYPASHAYLNNDASYVQQPQAFETLPAEPISYAGWTGYQPSWTAPHSQIASNTQMVTPISTVNTFPPTNEHMLHNANQLKKKRKVSIPSDDATMLPQQPYPYFLQDPTHPQNRPATISPESSPVDTNVPLDHPASTSQISKKVPQSVASTTHPAASTQQNARKTSNKRTLQERDDSDEGLENNGGVPSGHNAVEKRYRTKINSSLTTLQNLIPALSHLKDSDTPVAANSNRRTSAFILTAPQPTVFPAGTKIDGVEAPTKLSKGIILDKGIEYIQVLKRDRADLEKRLLLAEQILDTIPAARAMYEQRIPAARRVTAADGPARRVMYAVFAGVSLLGTASFGLDHSAHARGNVWANPVDLLKKAGDSDLKSMPTIGVVAILGWASVLLYYIFGLASSLLSKALARDAHQDQSERERALRVLAAYDQVDNNFDKTGRSMADIRRIREALSVLSCGSGLSVAGTFLGLAWEALMSYLISVGWSPQYLRGLSKLELLERCQALVRLAEFESSYGDAVCHRSARLYTFLRLHNLIRVSDWPNCLGDDEVNSVTLSRARVNATLSLCLVSIFAAQASALSRRRRLWNLAISEPKKESQTLEPWVEAALNEEYEDACASAFVGWNGIPSPSDTLPLLRVSESYCCKALIKVWLELFNMLVYTSVADLAPNANVKWTPAESRFTDLGIYLDSIVGSTVTGSPAHTLALLTKGFWCMGIGDMAEARHHAFVLHSEFRQRGPAAYLASVQAFIQLLLPSALDIKLDQVSSPTHDIDVVAFTCLRWLDLRSQSAALPTGTTSKNLYQTSLAVRQLFNAAIWRSDSFDSAQNLCIQMAELLGRKAAGMS